MSNELSAFDQTVNLNFFTVLQHIICLLNYKSIALENDRIPTCLLNGMIFAINLNLLCNADIFFSSK